jgi:hypothetical protein
MEHCGSGYEYKIHLPGSRSFVGSNSSHTAGDLYVSDRRFNISNFAQQRNKRVVDIGVAFLLLGLYPLAAFIVRQPGGLLRNILNVLAGRQTWVGYEGAGVAGLPRLKPSVLPPYYILDAFEPSGGVTARMNLAYAQHYNPSHDLFFILKNFRFLGRKAEKDFAEK